MFATRHGRPRLAAGVVVLGGLVAAVTLTGPGPVPEAAAQPAKGAAAAGDLAMVPADAAGFVHIRLADIWKNEMFAGFRKTWERAGAKALQTLDKQFVPAPSSLDRATAFVLLGPQKQEPKAFGILTFSAPFDPDQIAKVYLPNAEKRQMAGKTVYVDGGRGIAVTFPTRQHILVGDAAGLEAYLGKPVAKDGPMAAALKLAASRPVVAAANIAALPIPPNALDEVPAEVRPILKAKQVLLALDLGADAKVELRATYENDAAAADAEKAVKALVDLGRQKLGEARKELEDKLYDPKIKTPRPPEDLPEALGTVFALGALGRVDDLLADQKLVTRQKADLSLTVSMPRELVAWVGGTGAILIGAALPAVQKVRDAAGRTKSMNNLKQLMLAIHNYEAVNGKFPEDIKDKTGKPILSWRVAILPYIEQQALYQQFKLDEPWDGPNNKKPSKVNVPTFVSPLGPQVAAAGPDAYGMTSYKGVAGPSAVFDPKGKVTIVSITDGTSNTVALVEAGDPIPWAKPGDFPFDPTKPLPKLTTPGLDDLLLVAMCDGSVRAIDTKKVSERTLRSAMTRNGGEVLGKDWD